jgi:hypothetical protein
LGRDLQKPFGGFKTVNSILLTKYCSHCTEISTKDIVTHSMGTRWPRRRENLRQRRTTLVGKRETPCNAMEAVASLEVELGAKVTASTDGENTAV